MAKQTKMVSAQELGRRLAATRAYRGMTQRDVEAAADALGMRINKTTVSYVERGVRKDLTITAALCDIYKYPMETLLDPKARLWGMSGGDKVTELEEKLDLLTAELAELAGRIVSHRLESEIGEHRSPGVRRGSARS